MCSFRFILIICEKCAGIKKNQKYKNTLIAKERKNISSSIIIGNIRLKYNTLLYIRQRVGKVLLFWKKSFLQDASYKVQVASF